MKTSIRFLVFAGLFGLLTGTAYWFVTYEPAGTALLLMMGMAPLIIGGYFLRHAHGRRPPEDDPDAEHEATAGATVGSFSAGSVWPLVMGIACTLGVEGFIYGMWLVMFGLVLFAVAALGLMMESRG
jgi:cytochrome c oxidase subunit IV